MKENSIAVVVITFNRLSFLKEIIDALKNQTLKPDEIIVVNNSCTDGTADWLGQQEDLFIVSQPNVGSSGGQYTGIKTAYDLGYDWIWTMDDDVVPENDCLSLLYENINETSVHAPLRRAPDGTIYYNDAISYNLRNPFKSFWVDVVSGKNIGDKYIPAVGITFEGPLFHRSLVQKIGLPEKKFFIYADDTEYFIRATESGAKIFIVSNAKMNRKLNPTFEFTKYDWKHYYIIRNQIAIDRLHGTTSVKIIRPFFYFFRWLGRCRKPKDILILIKAFRDGYLYKSGN